MAGQWTDADRLALLVQFIPAKIDWATLQVPPGRTQKACQHVISKFKADAAGVILGNSPQAPVKKRKTPRKPSAADEKGSGDDDEDAIKPPAPKKRKAPVKKKLITHAGSGEDEEEEENVVKPPATKKRAPPKQRGEVKVEADAADAGEGDVPDGELGF